MSVPALSTPPAANSTDPISQADHKSAASGTSASASAPGGTEKVLSLVLPALIPTDEKMKQVELTVLVKRIYKLIETSKLKAPIGKLFMEYHFDFSKKGIKFPDDKLEKRVTHLTSYSYIQGKKCSSFKMVWEINGAKETFYIPNQEDFGLVFETLFENYCNGQEYERISHSTFPTVPEHVWANWEQDMSDHAGHYERVIYPQIVTTVEKVSSYTKRTLKILDLGGGSGKLAGRLISEVSDVTVLVAERDKKLLAQAENRAKSLKGKLTTIHVDLNKKKALKAFDTDFDIVIMCGVLAHQVLSKPVAQGVVPQCFVRLKGGGYVVAPSLSPSVITSTDYAKAGFVVLNKTLIFSATSNQRTNDFYIAQKPSQT